MGNTKSSHHELVVREMPHNVRQLHIAVKSNDRETVNDLLARGVNINFPFLCGSNPSIKDGNTPLIIAVSLNHTEMVEVLLRAGAYINKCDKNGCTPVYKAAFHGRPLLIELLAKAGADVNLADFQGQTPLFICVNNAIVHSCRLAIIKLLAAGAIVDKCDKLGQAPIHMATRWKLVDVLTVLVSAKSDVNLCDARGRTPLYVCVRSLTTKLYMEDLRHRMPCIVALFRARADMLNLVEWLLHKGPGIPPELLEPWPDFAAWYRTQVTQPMSLVDACRKVIQICLCFCARIKSARAALYYELSSVTNSTQNYHGTFISSGVSNIVQTRAVQSISKCFPSSTANQHNSSPSSPLFDDRPQHDGLVAAVKKLPVPQKLQIFLSRKMFYRELSTNSLTSDFFLNSSSSPPAFLASSITDAYRNILFYRIDGSNS